jgi:hypothetical protein
MAKIHRTRLMILALLLGSATQSTLAQINPAFARAVSDPREQSMVVDAAKRSNVVLESPCSEAHYSIADQFSIFEPLKFDNAGTLLSGSWKQVINYTGCGATRILNVLVSVEDGPRANARPLLPGTTHADARLQLDVFRSPAMQLQIHRWRDPSCTKVYVADTAFVDRESVVLPGARESGWHEVWTVVVCAQTLTMPVTFSPNSTGTSFTLSSDLAARDKPVNTVEGP